MTSTCIQRPLISFLSTPMRAILSMTGTSCLEVSSSLSDSRVRYERSPGGVLEIDCRSVAHYCESCLLVALEG